MCFEVLVRTPSAMGCTSDVLRPYSNVLQVRRFSFARRNERETTRQYVSDALAMSLTNADRRRELSVTTSIQRTLNYHSTVGSAELTRDGTQEKRSWQSDEGLREKKYWFIFFVGDWEYLSGKELDGWFSSRSSPAPSQVMMTDDAQKIFDLFLARRKSGESLELNIDRDLSSLFPHRPAVTIALLGEGPMSAISSLSADQQTLHFHSQVRSTSLAKHRSVKHRTDFSSRSVRSMKIRENLVCRRRVQSYTSAEIIFSSRTARSSLDTVNVPIRIRWQRNTTQKSFDDSILPLTTRKPSNGFLKPLRYQL